MTITAGLPELLAYCDHERAKWQAWVEADPSRLSLPFQDGARFPTIGSVLDHVFLVERRHLSRLEGATPPESTGVPTGQGQGGGSTSVRNLVRADFRPLRHPLSMTPAAGSPFPFTIPAGPVTMSRRRLATHVVLHEVRHLAQIAHNAGSPGVALLSG